MLSVEDNERLTRVGPGTPMGNAFRQFWLPFMLSDELANDAPPRRVRLLGEDLIAFRDTQGRPGLVDRYCPHRRADLYFGRNEQCGLRCAYHGWKFDVDGNVTDMPAEPANTPLLQDVKIKAYPMRDWGGVLWAYMGDPATMPDEVPQFEWGLVPPHRRFISKRLQQNNYAQAVEGGIDSAHVGILHSLLEPEPDTPFRQRQLPINPNLPLMAKDTAPRFFVRDTDYGFLVGARRNASEDEYYWRVTQFLLPFYSMIARWDGEPIVGHAWTPIDDHNTWTFTMTWHPERDFREGEQDPHEIHVEVEDEIAFLPVANKDNDYRIDREHQRLHSTTGIHGIGAQDAAIQEGMGPIVDRSRETLGAGDAAIVSFRRRLLKMARDVEAGILPKAAAEPDLYQVRSAGMVLGKGTDFVAGLASRMKARQ